MGDGWAQFANPNIIKIFHGADYDVIWLQRDLGLYVVNMFDTGQAARLFLTDWLCRVLCLSFLRTADSGCWN